MPTRPLSRSKLARKRRYAEPSERLHAPDLIFLALVAGITLFGLLMIANVSSYEGYHEFSDKFYFAKQQITWLGIGSIAAIFGYKLPLKFLHKISPILFVGGIFLLILVLIPGIGTKTLGARRWISVSNFIPGVTATIQPAELMKAGLILYFGAYLAKIKSVFSWSVFATFLGIVGLVTGLIMLEPDLGTTTIIVASIAAMYFLAGAPLKHFFVLVPVVAVAFISLIVLEPYRLHRLTTFLNPEIDPQGKSYHISQILMTLGSGGMFGVGLGNSGQKYGYLPEATTDSIFAVIAGELGFVGACVLIALYGLLLFRAFVIIKGLADPFARLVAVGITTWLGMQIIINMGSMVALFPLTGVPLPFISYGGSSLVMSLFASGLLLQLSRHARESTAKS